MDRVLRSHPQLLLALARFLLAGNEIYILRGNHDVEMFWPQVQDHFRLLLAQHHPADTTYLDMKAAVQARLHFRPWFFLDKDLLYVEHGCQYDPFCTNEHNLYPVMPDRPSQIHLPFSAFSMRYFAARMAMVDPAAIENVNSIPRYLGRLLARHPLQAFVLPYYYIEMIVRTLRKVRPGSAAGEREVRAREAAARDDLERMYALPPATVAAIEGLRETPILRSLPSTIKSFSLDMIGAGLATAAAIWLATPRSRRGRLARPRSPRCSSPGSRPAGSGARRGSTITATCARSRAASPTPSACARRVRPLARARRPPAVGREGPVVLQRRDVGAESPGGAVHLHARAARRGRRRPAHALEPPVAAAGGARSDPFSRGARRARA